VLTVSDLVADLVVVLLLELPQPAAATTATASGAASARTGVRPRAGSQASDVEATAAAPITATDVQRTAGVRPYPPFCALAVFLRRRRR